MGAKKLIVMRTIIKQQSDSFINYYSTIISACIHRAAMVCAEKGANSVFAKSRLNISRP